MERYSKKRKAILDCLCSTQTHPTAEWVYEQVHQIYPNISLGTVYRNISQLKAAGLIQSIGVVDGYERFDGNIEPHSHAICTKCGKVVDVENYEVSKSVIEETELKTGFQIKSATLQFFGVCEECQNQNNLKN